MGSLRKVSVLINRFAGNVRGATLKSEIETAVKNDASLEGVVSFIGFTEKGGNTSWCEKAIAECDVLLICGGDGTVHHVVNVLKKLSYKGAVSIFPVGTGNDLWRSLGFKPRPLAELLKKVAGNPEREDLDIFCVNGKAYFAGFIGFGFDAFVVGKYEKGVAGYKDSFLMKIPLFKMFLWFLYGLPSFLFYRKMLKTDKGESFNIIFSNLKSYAGGARFSENGKHDDGRLELLFAQTRFAVAKLMLNRPFFGRVFFKADAVSSDVPLKLSFDSPPPVQLDGEDYSHLFDGESSFEISDAGSLTVYR